MKFKTLADQEQARIVIKDAHAGGKLGWGREYYGEITIEQGKFKFGAPVCPIGHLMAHSIQFKEFDFLFYDLECKGISQEAGFTYAMQQIDDAEVG